MKFLLVMSIVLSSTAGFSKVFDDVDKNEAYANIMGLYIEELEKDIELAGLEFNNLAELKMSKRLAQKEIESTDVRESRMFLTLDFELMCESLEDKKNLNDKKINKYSRVLKRRVRKGSTRYNNYKRAKQITFIVKRNNELIYNVQGQYCNN